MADHICRSLYEDDEADEIDTLRARVAELEAKLKVAEEALTNVQKLDYFQEHNWLARNVDAALAKIKEGK